jgi:alpha-glucosidase
MLLMTLGGTPTHYYGEEVGMQGVPIPPEEARDPQGQRIGRNRDPERTPMQWDDSPKAGFTSGEPWLPIGDDVQAANVAAQAEDPRSLLTLYRRLIELRREQLVLVAGVTEVVSYENPLLAYKRIGEDRQYLVVLNMAGKPQSYGIGHQARGLILLSTFLDRMDEQVQDTIELRADEGVIISLSVD